MERKKLIYKIGAQTTITCNAMHERKKEWMRGWRGSGYMKHKKDDRLKENWVIYPINSYNFTKIRRWSSDDAWEKETKRETSREIKLATQNNTIVHVTKFFTWIPLNMQFFPSPLREYIQLKVWIRYNNMYILDIHEDESLKWKNALSFSRVFSVMHSHTILIIYGINGNRPAFLCIGLVYLRFRCAKRP